MYAKKVGNRNFKLTMFFSVLVAAAILLGACSPSPVVPTANNDQIATLVYQTAVAQATQSAFQTLVAQLTQVAQPSQTPAPTQQPPTDQPTAAPLPTNTSVPPSPTVIVATPTLAPTLAPTAIPVPCNKAQFVDETIKDGTAFGPGAVFKKTWKLKNVGTCTWTTSYALVFASGDQMDGKSAVNLTGDVAPGGVLEISVDLKAPSKPGTYQGYWKLRSSSGSIFGLGSSASEAFWVKIKVEDLKVVYDMLANYCSAEWRNAFGALPCPGTSGDAAGAVLKVDNPALEHRNEDEPILRVEPQVVDNGVITGKYPAFDVKSGDHFYAWIGCVANATYCNVTFQLNYQIEGGTVQNLKTWNETYDNKATSVDVDLSSLAGKKVTFFLSVSANGASNQDYAFWLMPRIIGPAR